MLSLSFLDICKGKRERERSIMNAKRKKRPERERERGGGDGGVRGPIVFAKKDVFKSKLSRPYLSANAIQPAAKKEQRRAGILKYE